MTYSQEQEQLRETLRAFLARFGDDKEVWGRLTGELGLTALAIDERYGGFGATLAEVGIALEETGRALLAAPYLPTVATAAALGEAAADELPGIAAGTTVATLAVAEPGTAWRLDALATTARESGGGWRLDGVKEYVLDGQHADLLAVVAEGGLFLVRAEETRRTGHSTLDQTRPQARVVFDGAPGVRVGDGRAAAHAVDLHLLALAAESVGVARASLEATAAHLLTRTQFGVPLATFQALRHRVADLAVKVEAATSTVWYALRADPDELPVAAPLAKVVATEAAYAVTAESIQLHGGIGFTWEHDAHRYFKRATANRLLFGDPVTLRRLVGARAGI
ncbi:acyl-CoA dehydrogenase family protein [Phytohabitans sp. ZYX-F-186]|uniref:Acyl-CoA dehydrogenase family protein n=1 Tax=Phytohabitans maris TaxID=3071409 RepID=A0ABU0Z9N4_9ACTN|nr:acyl-CoA dehydrogenase family protein [Phytohabitans sp. ZYX-F-186]MDQ7903745.1 acyl-CoA dehydrogenase family protein [Phytohabitans sp. ZYX-F-186]